jgi:hypothetical protein
MDQGLLRFKVNRYHCGVNVRFCHGCIRILCKPDG